MKKIITVLLLIGMSLSVLSAAAISSSPAATVNLIRNTRITVDQLNAKIAELGATQDQALDVLNIMINDEVFLQGAERDGITVNDTQKNGLYSQMKTQIEQSNGVTLTQAEFDQLAIDQYGSVEAYKEYLAQNYIVQAYLAQEKGDELNSRNFTPTDTEINTYYRRNRTSFTQAENVYFAHVYKGKTGDAATDSANSTLLKNVAADIRSGKITFEAAVANYTDDKESIATGGVMGYLSSDNTTVRQGWGDDFVDDALSLEIGVPTYLESNTGYHIVKVISHNDARMLTLDDRIDPTQNYTVRDYITEGLAYQNYQTALTEALNDLIAELRSEASIRILYK
ncbi:MAG: peptidylprolyl isomerase [Bullifex sp.]|nr:peptidylprolyl isomerase [Spirochaetales bacterium]MDY2816610.1 peptidylprolyl isomerase [Bullifex sp.]MDD7009104.1 peptidylprolyl isomerase [Spirochaetales bacterium]MDD7535435.1 peptidylprolyl isomerase [Spirochaetales bacterium]MDY3850741.1 peptidylprolyl isomerase [Bullifex sp.]